MKQPSTLLIVDDEAVIVKTLRLALEPDGYRILTTTSPLEALSILERERVDVLVSDIDMPELDGLELVQRVRETYPIIVRVLLTARSGAADVLKAINQGEVYRYVTKPWNIGELRVTLKQAARRASEQRRAASALIAEARRSEIVDTVLATYPGLEEVVLADGAYPLSDAMVGATPSQRGRTSPWGVRASSPPGRLAGDSRTERVLDDLTAWLRRRAP